MYQFLTLFSEKSQEENACKTFCLCKHSIELKVGFSAVKYCKQVESSGFWLCIFVSQWTQTLFESVARLKPD